MSDLKAKLQDAIEQRLLDAEASQRAIDQRLYPPEASDYDQDENGWPVPTPETEAWLAHRDYWEMHLNQAGALLDKDGRLWVCIPVRDLAEAVGIGEATVRKHLKALCDDGGYFIRMKPLPFLKTYWYSWADFLDQEERQLVLRAARLVAQSKARRAA